MACQRIRDWVADAPRVRPAEMPGDLRQHAAGCADCRADLAALERFALACQPAPAPDRLEAARAAVREAVAISRSSAPGADPHDAGGAPLPPRMAARNVSFAQCNGAVAHDGRQCPVAARMAARNASFAQGNGANPDEAGTAGAGVGQGRHWPSPPQTGAGTVDRSEPEPRACPGEAVRDAGFAPRNRAGNPDGRFRSWVARWWPAAAVAALALVLLATMIPAPSPPRTPTRSVVITRGASISSGAPPTAQPLAAFPYSLPLGETLNLGPGPSPMAAVVFPLSGEIVFSGQARIVMAADGFRLAEGGFVGDFRRTGQPFRIVLPTVVIAVRGTRIRFAISPDGVGTLEVLQGSAELLEASLPVRQGALPMILAPGQHLVLASDHVGLATGPVAAVGAPSSAQSGSDGASLPTRTDPRPPSSSTADPGDRTGLTTPVGPTDEPRPPRLPPPGAATGPHPILPPEDAGGQPAATHPAGLLDTID